MQVFYSTRHPLHAPLWYVADGTVRPCPEVPARAEALHRAIAALPEMQLATADHVDPWPALRAIHTPDYLHYLETIYPIWSAEFVTEGRVDVLPDTFPRCRGGTSPRPSKPSAQAGYYCFDMAAPITDGTFEAALASARCAVAAADGLLTGPSGRRAAYAICRPPGHHAGPDYCGGFCYLNNAAAAAQQLLLKGMSRIALLDIDYHQGNGTQDIFYPRNDVLFLSIHADPHSQYPYFWGYANECGTGAGEGFTRNFPLPRGAGDAVWFEALGKAMARITEFRAEALIVSLGLDISKADPVGDFQLSRESFAQIGSRLASLSLPTAFIQEGGYNVADLGGCAAALLTGFQQPRDGAK